MRSYGDIPEEDKILLFELIDQERSIKVDQRISQERKSQVYVCLAHDYFGLYMEEEGNRLLDLADKTYPGYFKEKIHKHAKEYPAFSSLVVALSVCSGREVMEGHGFKFERFFN